METELNSARGTVPLKSLPWATIFRGRVMAVPAYLLLHLAVMLSAFACFLAALVTLIVAIAPFVMPEHWAVFDDDAAVRQVFYGQLFQTVMCIVGWLALRAVGDRVELLLARAVRRLGWAGK